MSDNTSRFLLRLSTQLYRDLRRLAADNGVSLNRLCESALRQTLEPRLAGDTTSPLPWLSSWIEAIRDEWGSVLLGVILFGSAARGEMHAGSDVDLLLVLSDESPVSRELYSTWEKVALQRRLKSPFEVSPQFVRLPPRLDDAGGIWFETAIDGIVLWERDARIRSFLSEVRKAMAEGKIQRSSSHGHPYWKRVG